jgi:hypothetical protein
MDDPNTTTGILDEADEDILTGTVSDDALEALAADAGKLVTYSFGQAFCCP